MRGCMNQNLTAVETKETNSPDTVFARDIETRVFQAIAVKCLSKIKGISLLEGNMLDSFLGREGPERIKGIVVEQDSKSHSVNIKVELSIAYGLSIPEKAKEIQSRLVDDITRLTGLHVAGVHVVFKNLLPEKQLESLLAEKMKDRDLDDKEITDETLDEYSEEF
jgi:uncharacterized alkaline shock family protein YloU